MRLATLVRTGNLAYLREVHALMLVAREAAVLLERLSQRETDAQSEQVRAIDAQLDRLDEQIDAYAGIEAGAVSHLPAPSPLPAPGAEVAR